MSTKKRPNGEDIRDILIRACKAGGVTCSHKTWAIDIDTDDDRVIRIRFEDDGSVEGAYVCDHLQGYKGGSRQRVEYDGAEVPIELMGILADCCALMNGLPGTLTLGGKLATIRRCGARVVIEPGVTQP